jgi:hypothetical protein
MDGERRFAAALQLASSGLQPSACSVVAKIEKMEHNKKKCWQF